MRTLSTVIPFGFEFEPARFLAAYQSLGCGVAQLYRNPSNAPAPADMLRIARDAGYEIDSIHALFSDAIDPSSLDPAHRDECLRLYEREGILAREVGASAAVVHPAANLPGYRVMAPLEAEQAQATRWTPLADFLRRLADVAERLNMTYLIENLPRTFYLGHDSPRLAEAILEVRSPRIRMCFDTGHAHLTGDVCEQLRLCAPAVGYMHIHDNDGTTDNHRMPGDGSIRWTKFAATLRAMKIDVPCMLEVFYPEAQVESMACEGLAAFLASACALSTT